MRIIGYKNIHHKIDQNDSDYIDLSHEEIYNEYINKYMKDINNDFLEELNVRIYEFESCEITDIPLISHIAKQNKPIIMSTGIASEEDIDLAIKTIRKHSQQSITLLQCTSSYPASIEDANLSMIPALKKRFNVDVGLSDHTLGTLVPTAAAALGITVIEKHFILDRALGGPDSGFSLEPEEFRQMVNAVRNVEKSLGTVDFTLTEKKQKNRIFSRSLFVVEDVQKGEKFSNKNVRSIRPGHGMHPKYLNEILGKEAKENIKRGTPLKDSMIKDFAIENQ